MRLQLATPCQLFGGQGEDHRRIGTTFASPPPRSAPGRRSRAARPASLPARTCASRRRARSRFPKAWPSTRSPMCGRTPSRPRLVRSVRRRSCHVQPLVPDASCTRRSAVEKLLIGRPARPREEQRLAVHPRHGLEDGEHRRDDGQLVPFAGLAARRRQAPERALEVELVPMRLGQLGAARAGKDEQPAEVAPGPTHAFEGAPDGGELGPGQRPLAAPLLVRQVDAGRRVRFDDRALDRTRRRTGGPAAACGSRSRGRGRGWRRPGPRRPAL